MAGLTPAQALLQQGVQITKSAITQSNLTTIFTAEQADHLLNWATDQSVILKLANQDRFEAPTKNIDDFDANDEPLVPAVPGISPGQTATVVTHRHTLTPKLVRAFYLIDFTSMTSTVDGPQFFDNFLKTVMLKVGNQLDAALIYGSKWGGTANPGNIRSLYDGMEKNLRANGNVVDMTGYTDRLMSFAKMSAMLKAMPENFRGNDADLRWLMAPGIIQDYSDLWQVPQVPMSIGEAQYYAHYQGIPGVKVPKLGTSEFVTATYSGGNTTLSADATKGATVINVADATSIVATDHLVVGVGLTSYEAVVVASVSGTAITLTAALYGDHASGEVVKETTATTLNGSSVMLIDPRHIRVGFKRAIEIKTQPDIETDSIKVSINMEVDTLIDNPAAGVIGINFQSK